MKEDVKRIINDNLYMTIATTSFDGKPWITPVFFSHNNNFKLYWYSPKESSHSKNIRENEYIAATIFNSTAIGDNIEAVYIKAKAYEITSGREIISGLTIYSKKLLKTGVLSSTEQAIKYSKSQNDFRKKSPLRMYVAIPYEISLLAPSRMYKGHYIDSRIIVK